MNETESIDEVLIAALAAGMTHAQAGVLAGVCAKTVQRRHAEEAFVTEIARRRAIRVDEVTGRLSELSVHALETVESCLTSGSSAVRLKAAEMVFVWFRRLRDEVDVDTRLARLESSIQPDRAGVAPETSEVSK